MTADFTGLALPMHQPWASLAAAGVKTIETRPRRSNIRGTIGVFACQGVPNYVYDLLDSKAGRVLVHLCQRHLPGFDPTRRGLGLPLGQVIALVDQYDSVPMTTHCNLGDPECLVVGDGTLDHCIPSDADQSASWGSGAVPDGAFLIRDVSDQLPFGDFRPGRHGWLWRNAAPLADPITLRGHQGWMRFDLREVPA